MSYVVFARKWRPKNFDEIIGQEHITTTLKNAIEKDKVAHAYIFSGPRGTGKTTTARLLAKALNCEKGPTSKPCNKCVSCKEITQGSSMDIIEIDAASNRGIDDVRDIRENVKFKPHYGKYKIYIIDEVHMLTPEAFNALLKTLEEPPSHVKFIFATTAIHKVLPTILSRCQKFDFRRIALKDIISKLKKIAKQESVKIDEKALFAIARAASGSMRDAESVLDQLNSFTGGKITFESITSILGVMPQTVLTEYTDYLIKKDTKAALDLIDRIITEGKDGYQFLVSMIEYFRDLMIIKQGEQLSKMIDATEEEIEIIKNQATSFTIEDILYTLYALINTQQTVKFTPTIRIPLEMLSVKLTRKESIVSLAEILKRIATLEKNITFEQKQPFPSPVKESTPAQTKQTDANQEPHNPTVQNTHNVSIYQLREIWPTAIKRIKVEKMYLASCLETAEILEFKDNILTLGYAKNNKFHTGVLEKTQNKKLVEDIISELLGARVVIECVLSDKIQPKQEETSEDKSEKHAAPTKESMKKMLSDPIIQSALDIFDGNVMKFM